MGLGHGPNIVNDGLVFSIDPINPKSWSGPDSDKVRDFKSTITGSIYNDTSGSYGPNKSFTFDGVNSGSIDFTIPSQTLYHLNIWFSRTSGINNDKISSNQTLLGWGLSGDITGIWFGGFTGAATDETILLFKRASGTNNITYTRTTANSDMHNLAINWNSNDTKYDMYLDGLEIPTFPSDNSGNNLPQITINHIYLGRSNDSNYHHTGNIANTQIYNRSLSSQEIQQNYKALKGRFIN